MSTSGPPTGEAPSMLNRGADAVIGGVGKGLGVVGDGIKAVESSKILKMIRFFNFINGIALACLWPLAFVFNQITNTTSGAVTSAYGSPISPNYIAIASYSIAFSLMLIAFELHLKRTELYFRENCGFMFSFSGRTAFLFFLASLSLAATVNTYWPAIIISIGTIINSIFNCFVIYSHPAFQKGGPLDPNMDPTEAYADSRGAAAFSAPTTATNRTSVPSVGVPNTGNPYAPPRHVPSSPGNPYQGQGSSDNPFSAGNHDDNPFGTGVV